MTHGEAWYKQKQHVDLRKQYYNGPKQLPAPMSHDDAVNYYNEKLFNYWVTKLDDRLSIRKRAQIISVLMYGDTERYKLYREKRCQILKTEHSCMHS